MITDLTFENCERCKNSYKDLNGNVLCGKAKSGDGFVRAVIDKDDFVLLLSDAIKCTAMEEK